MTAVVFRKNVYKTFTEPLQVTDYQLRFIAGKTILIRRLQVKQANIIIDTWKGISFGIIPFRAFGVIPSVQTFLKT